MQALHITHMQVQGQAVECSTSDGANVTARFLSPTLARVTLRPAAGFKEPRTWAIAPLPNPSPATPSTQTTQDTPWEGRARASTAGFDLPDVQVSNRTASSVCLSTSALHLTLQTHPLRLEWSDARSNTSLLADRATSAYMTEQRTGAVRHYLQRETTERFYGLGDKTGPLNLAGRRLRTAAMDSLGYDPEHGDPLYKHWPFVLSRTASGQWTGIYYDTLANCSFDLGCEHDNYHGFYRYVEIDDGDLDYYLMVGNTPAEVISQWLRLIGGTHMPPRWSLGFAQTAMGLADAPDAQVQLDKFIDTAVAHGVPISAFHYGSGYSSKGKRRYVFTWNHAKFPDPKTLNAKFHAHGMHLVANIKPCLLDDHPAYPTLESAGAFIQHAQTSQPVIEPFWDGEGSHLDFTHPKAIDWWQKNLQVQVLDYGIDVGWNDNNEYAILDEHAQSAGFGSTIPMHRSRPLHALLMTRATFEAQQSHRATVGKNEPTFTVTRAGSPGLQRYAQTWSGDNTTSWRTLRWNIRTGLQMSLSGMFNVGHDVGGFYGPIPEPELFVRWVQASCLNPRMVMNSWKEGGISNVPWMHPEVTQEVIRAIGLRYTLMPTLWALFERASQHHEPIIRPTFYDFPDDEQCYVDCDEFMVGNNLLVAPVVESGMTERSIYLPKLATPDAAWYDFETGERYAAGQAHTVPTPLSKLPLFVRSGARISVAQATTGQRPSCNDPITQVRGFGV
jgi:alpha-glucosidase